MPTNARYSCLEYGFPPPGPPPHFTCPSWPDMQLMTLWQLGDLKPGHISV